MDNSKCRFCGGDLEYMFADLGLSPLANGYLTYENSKKASLFYPLCAYICHNCFLAQALDYQKPEELFEDYKYLSSNSKVWLKHTETYVDMITRRLKLDNESLVCEIASNDGYLLQFLKKAGIKNFGVEPAPNLAKLSHEKGLDVHCDFFGVTSAEKLAKEKGKADLIIANNVLAHVPDINDFVYGLNLLLKPTGTITMEFPHLLNMIRDTQFDTIYHEHFSYLSFFTVIKIFEKHGMKIYDVQKLQTHGGSLRIYASHMENRVKKEDSVSELLEEELEYGIDKVETYKRFQSSINIIKFNAVKVLSELKLQKKVLLAYGAAAKGNTFLNYCGLGREYFDYIVDVTADKQGLYLPGTLIQIANEDVIERIKPDYLAVLPWNWKDEIAGRLAFTRKWGCKFITFIPQMEIF